MLNSGNFLSYSKENGERILILFLLFILAIYEFINAGFNMFAIICISPIIIILLYSVFKWRTSGFWLLIIVNYIIPFKLIHWPIPTSLIDEGLEIVLLAVAIIDARQTPHFERALNLMLFAILIWLGLCFIEVFNDTCGLGMNVNAWFKGARIMAFQLLWIILVFTVYVTSPKVIIYYLRLWACLSLFSAFWTWKMKTLGLTPEENSFLYGAGSSTHLLNAGSLIRYWSTFTDAANYGCNAGAAASAFLIIGITTKLKNDRLLFLLTSAVVVWGMFQSGTRTAIYCLAMGLIVYIFLSKSFKIAIPFTVITGIFAFILIFTNIGDSNQQIRRMRSAFNKNDASANVRDVNKAAIANYIKDAPWGIGIGIYSENIPAWNKFKLLSEIPPDSEYVYIWVRTGPIGVTIFALCMLIMLGGASYIVLFKLKSRSLIGLGGSLCCAFAAIQLGGYANQVIYQYPNGLIFYGGLAIVYVLPYLESDWIKYEEERLAMQEERKRLKLEKRLAKRV